MDVDTAKVGSSKVRVAEIITRKCRPFLYCARVICKDLKTGFVELLTMFIKLELQWMLHRIQLAVLVLIIFRQTAIITKSLKLALQLQQIRKLRQTEMGSAYKQTNKNRKDAAEP